VGSSVCTRIETALHPWVSYLIMPLFALANAGVDVRGLPLTDGGLTLRVAAGIVLGLVVGKPLGIIVTSLLSVRLGLAARPAQLRSRHLVLLGSLGGIGFTMSMFLSNLAFTDAALLRTAKLAVLTASLLAALIGVTVGRCLPCIRQTGA
jgi:NhaA family Na+:H+ antiporter